MKILPILLLLWSLSASAQDVPVIKLRQLEEILASKEKRILVVNFWATWCAPCVKELPYFETLHKSSATDAKVILINLDFADKLDRVKSFVSRKKMEATVFLLDEIDYNSWIDKVDPSWQGAIPATLVINTQTGQRKFIANELEEGQLDQIISEISKG
jgi:thiol-disulfide isomerase/thioredoxin